MRPLWLLLAALCGAAQAQELCFVLAENYYEQVYCELQAKGEGSTLPRFHEFKNNPPITQALLLKRPAGRIGITLKMPAAAPANPQHRPADRAAMPEASALAGCKLDQVMMLCGDKHYRLVGNQANSRLAEGALTEANQLILPKYRGGGLDAYLANAYRHYLDKMLSIGLGGSTMSYAKFYYLYQDLTDQGVDFVERSQTVFNYLKADKKRLGVSETVTPAPAASLAGCNRFGDRLLACDYGLKNYLYRDDNN